MNKPIKIIFDASSMASPNKTGVGHLERLLITELAKKYPEEVNFIGYYYNFLNRKKVELPNLKSVIYKPIILYPGKLTNLLRRCHINLPMELLAKSKGDIGLFLNFLSQPSIFNKPSIPFIHDLSYIYYPAFAADKNRRDLEHFIPKTLKRAKAVLTNSDLTKKTIIKEFSYPTNQILVTHIPPEPIDKKAASRLTVVKNKFNISKPYILFIGTLEPRKNLTKLLDAYKLSSYLQQNYSLVIAGGTDWKYGETVEKIKELQGNGLDVIQTGYVDLDERNTLYAGASLFVMPSHFEGFGIPILEAFSYGVPVCLSDIPIFHEVASDAAVYFDKDKPASIAETLESVLKNKLKMQQLIIKGKKQLRNYSWDKVTTDVFDLLQKITK